MDRVLLGGGWSFLGCQTKSQMIRDFHFFFSFCQQSNWVAYPFSLLRQTPTLVRNSYEFSCEIWMFLFVDLMIDGLTHTCSNRAIKYVPLDWNEFNLMSFNSKFLGEVDF